MILAYFRPLLEPSAHLIGHSLAQRAYPLDRRTPETIEEVLKRLDRR